MICNLKFIHTIRCSIGDVLVEDSNLKLILVSLEEQHAIVLPLASGLCTNKFT